MTLTDVSAMGGLLISLGGLVLQIITAVNLRQVKIHTNSMMDTMVADAEEKGRQKEKDNK